MFDWVPIIGPILTLAGNEANRVGEQVFKMVVDLLGGLFAGVINSVGVLVSLLPDAADLGLPDLSGWIVAYGWLNSWLPVAEGIAATVIYLGAANAAFLWQLAVRVWHLIPKPLMGT